MQSCGMACADNEWCKEDEKLINNGGTCIKLSSAFGLSFCKE